MPANQTDKRVIKRRPNSVRTFDQDLLDQLTEIRIREQVAWKNLPPRYMEILPEGHPDHDRVEPDWRILQREMMKNVTSFVLPLRVHRKMRVRFEEELDKADLGVMLMNILWSRYAEWQQLHDKMLRNAFEMPERGQKASWGNNFSEAERQRMDELGDSVLSTLFRLTEVMRAMNIQDNSLFALMQDTIGEGPAVRQLPSDNDTEVINVTKQMLQEVSQATTQMMEGINKRHREEGRGHHREIIDAEYDPLEVD